MISRFPPEPKTPGERADYLLSERFQNASRSEIRAAIVKAIEDAEEIAAEKALASAKQKAIERLLKVEADALEHSLLATAEQARARIREMSR